MAERSDSITSLGTHFHTQADLFQFSYFCLKNPPRLRAGVETAKQVFSWRDPIKSHILLVGKHNHHSRLLFFYSRTETFKHISRKFGGKLGHHPRKKSLVSGADQAVFKGFLKIAGKRISFKLFKWFLVINADCCWSELCFHSLSCKSAAKSKTGANQG